MVWDECDRAVGEGRGVVCDLRSHGVGLIGVGRVPIYAVAVEE